MTIYFAPIYTHTMTSIKRARCLLLVLPVCASILGCDSHSTPFDERSVTKSSLQNATHDEEASNINSSDIGGDDEVSPESGESLMTAAAPVDKSQSSRAPMIAESNNSSSMRATLIGDYVGMLPCSFCDTIEVTLNLFADGSVLKTSLYQNPKTPRLPLVESGIYRQDNNMITIVYSDQRIESYRIQNSHLVLLDDNKAPDADYTLTLK